MKDVQARQDRKKRVFSSSRTFLNNIFNTIPDLVSIVDRDYRIVFSNWKSGHDYVDPVSRRQKGHCYEVYYPGRTTRCEPCHLETVFETGKPLITEKFNPRVTLKSGKRASRWTRFS